MFAFEQRWLYNATHLTCEAVVRLRLLVQTRRPSKVALLQTRNGFLVEVLDVCTKDVWMRTKATHPNELVLSMNIGNWTETRNAPPTLLS
jgi:hypothetical protein